LTDKCLQSVAPSPFKNDGQVIMAVPSASEGSHGNATAFIFSGLSSTGEGAGEGWADGAMPLRICTSDQAASGSLKNGSMVQLTYCFKVLAHSSEM
jgi:hypothetical protein